MSDEEQRIAEIESLASIFPDLLEETTDKQLVFKFDRDIGMTINLPEDYPSISPPIFELSGPYLRREQKEVLHNSLNDVYIENIGFPVIFNWISLVQDFIRF
ncbi:Protein IMPACT homolog [Caenorhabditis elegans]|uniref:Isoform b of Protein IMPACT homolog n=1 Tax=Caenorhabditis elegans TaxID=6239 RepID=Q9XWF4-2|nr:Protein IMPACT homolog [Caenorhabditis elegans]CAE54915.1 Protein IMPACT homolog [Caenorhabditis elegans]|eukprot:NP_001021783.1 Protein IMPACT homolog [Caenorhabditis elegans]